VAGSCEYGDEPAGYGATYLISSVETYSILCTDVSTRITLCCDVLNRSMKYRYVPQTYKILSFKI
jgi:hypothetical protein